MARVNDKILVAVAVLVTAVLCVSGMNMMLDSSGKEQNVYISVSEDIEDEIRALFEGFETYTHSKLHISSQQTPSFTGRTDVIMTSTPVTASELATDSLPAGDIDEKIMFTPDGTKIYVFFDMKRHSGMVGALMNWAFTHKQDLFVLVSRDIFYEANEFFKDYENATNIKVNLVPADDLSFSGDVNMIMTSTSIDPNRALPAGLNSVSACPTSPTRNRSPTTSSTTTSARVGLRPTTRPTIGARGRYRLNRTIPTSEPINPPIVATNPLKK